MVPATVEKSKIRITAGSEVIDQYAAIADRYVGDVTGDNKVNSTDASQILIYRAEIELPEDQKTTVPEFKAVAGDVTGEGDINSTDASQILIYRAEIELPEEQKTTVNKNMGDGVYLGGNVTPEGGIKDPFVDAPAVKKLDKPANVYAYAQNGKIYYTFDAVANATAYVIKSGETTIATQETATGSFEYADFVEGMKITVTATADGFTDSDPSDEIDVIEADASGALAEWLEANGLEDVAITVHEIK